MKDNGSKALDELRRDFSLTREDVMGIVKGFHHEMERGLLGKSSSLKMLPSYVERPSGNERGTFMALDLGGTNFRVIRLNLLGRGRIDGAKIVKFATPHSVMTGRGKDLFLFLARSIKKFMSQDGISFRESLDLGFTFSFPIRQYGISSGDLVVWTKGFSAKGVVGRDVVGLLEDALIREEMTGIKVSALANDTVGTLVARAYSDPACDVGVIIGTGTNACYCEEVARIKKLRNPGIYGKDMVVNIEWGNFDRLHQTRYDRQLDKGSKNPGSQMLEKMVSGMYLGELARLAARDFVEKGLFSSCVGTSAFSSPGCLSSKDLSEVVSDNSRSLSRSRSKLAGAGALSSRTEDRKILKDICGLVSVRAARISAAAMAGVATKIDRPLGRRHTIAVDGSVYEKHPGFSAIIRSVFKEIFRSRHSNLRLELTKDGSGKGAAIIAAVASSEQVLKSR